VERSRGACAQKANIFLMDEGTSALDATTEKKVQRGLDAECEGQAMISIAHRLEIISNSNSNSDLILVFSEGRLMEKGKYLMILAVIVMLLIIKMRFS
jgi:ATP-binding cassette subfamily B protein